MEGKSRACGAVASVRTVKNPISLARKVMTETRHVLLVADGAAEFAKSIQNDPMIEIVVNGYFRNKKLKEADNKTSKQNESESPHIGTVGCVALDSSGNIAAGTSTGGLSGKKFGRVGDSPIVAAGTYADNSTCGVSCTGVGEDFIRNAIAYDVSARMKYLDQSLEDAAKAVIFDDDHPVVGGMISIDKLGNITTQFNTPGMARAAADSNGLWYVKLGK